MPYPGEIFAGTYQVMEEIGKGGAGIIYKAYHLNLQKYVVLKKIKDNCVGALDARGEADILKALHHTYLPQVYDFLQIGQEIYTVMEYIEGKDLKYYLDRGYRFDEAMLWHWLQQLAEVLEYLHQHGILHLDIKPANIMLTAEGNICLIDFNISLTNEMNGINGISMAYASPEMYAKWMGNEVSLDARTDIYSLGATFYQLMTGYVPSPVQGQMMPLEAFSLPYSKAFVSIICKMLKNNREQRYADVTKLKRAIHREMRSKAEKNTLRAVFGMMLVAVIVLLLVLGGMLFQSFRYVSTADKKAVYEEELRIADLCQSGEYEIAYREVTEFMGEQEDAIEKLQGARQRYLELLVDICIGAEKYSQAEVYLQELFRYEYKPEYYCDLAIIKAYLGEFREAESALEQATQYQGDTIEIRKCRAEIYAAQKKYAQALAEYQILYQSSQSSGILRRMAALALLAAGEDSQYLATASDYYEQLITTGFASYADKSNLVTSYEKRGMNERATEILQSMLVDYPTMYQVPLRLGIIKYNAEMKKAPANRDFSQVKKYALKAQKLHLEMGNEADEQLNYFLKIIEEMP